MRPSRLLDAVASRTARDAGLSFAVIVLVVGAAVGLLAETGVSHVTRFGHDDFIFLDGGWRVLSGQRPHVDFHTPLGLFTPMLVALAMRVAGASASALGVAVILFVVTSTLWAWAVSRGRLAPWLGAAFALVVASAGIGQYTLSFDWLETSHASIFNRFGYAILSILLIECLAPLGSPSSRRARVASGVSSGVALSLLFFIKPTFALQGAVLVGVSAWALENSRERWLGIAAGAVVATVTLLVLARTSPGAILADYAMGGAARASSIGANEETTVFLEMSRRDSFSATPAKILEILRYDFWTDLAVIAMAALLPSPHRRRWLLLVAMVIVTSIPVVFTNWQWGEAPSTAAFAVVIAEAALRARASDAPPLASLSVVALLLFVAGQSVFKGFGSMAAAWSWHETVFPAMPAESRFAAPPLASLIVLRSDGYCKPNQYAQKVNEGLSLLGAPGVPRSPKIFVADFSNPFSLALRAPPARGGEMWWHLGATFNAAHAPSADDALGDADVVMIPKCPEETPTRDAILSLYGPYLSAHFDKQGESAMWALFVRGHATTTTPP